MNGTARPGAVVSGVALWGAEDVPTWGLRFLAHTSDGEGLSQDHCNLRKKEFLHTLLYITVAKPIIIFLFVGYLFFLNRYWHFAVQGSCTCALHHSVLVRQVLGHH